MGRDGRRLGTWFVGTADVAAEFDAAVLAVMHFKKGAEADALYRVSGAAGFGNAARSVLAAARDPRDETRRVIVHVKNNYGVEKPAIRFEVQPVGESSAVVFGAEDASLTQREVFGQTPGPEPYAQDEAVEFLLSELADGPKSAKDVVADAKAAGVTEATLRRAKKRLHIAPTAVRGDDNRITGWLWALPEAEVGGETSLS
jgi:putative DNA primase/helicase